MIVKSKKTVRIYDPINHELSYRYMDWMDSAGCRGQHISTFFLPQGDNIKNVAKAKAICAACPVRPDCLKFAVANAVVGGIWGGKTPLERAKIIRRGKGS